MGDSVLATPIIRFLYSERPDLRIDILLEALPASALGHNPHVNEVIIAPSRGSGLSRYLPLVRKLQYNRYDLVLDFLSTPGSALLTRLTGAPLRAGWALPGRFGSYNHAIVPPTTLEYAVRSKMRFFRSRRLDDVPEDDMLPVVYPGTEDREWAKVRLQSLHIGGRLTLALAPFCKREHRQWPLTCWTSLCDSLQRRYRCRFLLFAADAERDYLISLERALGESVSWAGSPDPLKAAALMQHTTLLLSGENGLLHLGIASDIPAWAVFAGKDAPEQWLPGIPSRSLGVDLRIDRNEKAGLDIALTSAIKFIEHHLPGLGH